MFADIVELGLGGGRKAFTDANGSDDEVEMRDSLDLQTGYSSREGGVVYTLELQENESGAGARGRDVSVLAVERLRMQAMIVW
jgi:hypothetical protein